MNIENEPAAKEAETLTGDALTIAFLKANLEELRTGGIVTVAMTNPNVMSYMEHWEGRAEKAEKRVEELEAALRVHNSDSAEPVATMHVSESETLFSKGYDGKGLMGFASKPLYLASPPAKEVDSDSVTYVLEWTSAPRPPAHPVSMRGRQGFNSIERARKRFQSLAPDSSDVKLTKCVETSTDITAALTNRTPDDEVRNG